MAVEIGDDQYIIFLDWQAEAYKVPYFNKNERFAELCDIKLTLEYNFNPNGNGR